MHRLRLPRGLVSPSLLNCLVIPLLAVACAAEQSGSRGPGTGGGAAVGGTGVAGFAAGTGAAGSFGHAGSGFAGNAGSAGSFAGTGAAGSGIDPNACGGTSVEPKVIEVEVEVEVAEPLAIYIMLDNSGSMIGLWPGAISAITQFVNDPASAGLDVAVNLFPGVQFAAACDGAAYVAPVIPLGRLPAHAQSITSMLPPFPAGFNGTNIEPALRGATQYCKNFTPADPADAGEECIVLFITDGDPSTCNLDKSALAQIAGDAFTQDQVRTFSIALAGADVTFLDDMAKRGGGDCDTAAPIATCDLTQDAMGMKFSAALSAIRDTVVKTETRVEKQALECEWGIPDTKDGTSFMQDLVNVNFTAAPGGPVATFGNVPAASACADRADAWHYDDADNPTRILACPKTCDALKGAPDGRVDIVLGCPILIIE